MNHFCCPESWTHKGPWPAATDSWCFGWRWAVTTHSNKTKTPPSLKGKLCEGGIQFHLPFSNHPPGTQEWKEHDWEGKKAKEIETHRREMGRGSSGRKQVRMNAWRIVSRKQNAEEERMWEAFLHSSSPHSLPFSLRRCSGYLLWSLLSRWNEREMGS